MARKARALVEQDPYKNQSSKHKEHPRHISLHRGLHCAVAADGAAVGGAVLDTKGREHEGGQHGPRECHLSCSQCKSRLVWIPERLRSLSRRSLWRRRSGVELLLASPVDGNDFVLCTSCLADGACWVLMLCLKPLMQASPAEQVPAEGEDGRHRCIETDVA